MEAQLPTAFYVVIGVLVFGNLGLILSLLTIIFKAGRFVTATEMGIKDAKECGVRAHKRLDILGVAK